ncbi:MAG: polysaccharide deacetylase family protein [Ferruginibacter sp.]
MNNIQKKIPVLMYHALTEEQAEHPSIHISIKLFLQQLEWLSENKYCTISIDQMLEGFKTNEDFSNCCVITFDDGYYSLYKHALPLLKKYNFTATLFLTTGAVNQNNFNGLPFIYPDSLPVKDRPLTWNEIKEMHRNGWSVQSHSITHADNSKLSAQELSNELKLSRAAIEQELQQSVMHYAFPFGKYSSESLKFVEASGYASAFTVHPGLCTAYNNHFRLPRIEINSKDNIPSFSKKINSGYPSLTEKIRGTVRDILFKNPAVKDLSKRIAGKKIN